MKLLWKVVTYGRKKFYWYATYLTQTYLLEVSDIEKHSSLFLNCVDDTEKRFIDRMKHQLELQSKASDFQH
jgi:hypothetical protein